MISVPGVCLSLYPVTHPMMRYHSIVEALRLTAVMTSTK